MRIAHSILRTRTVKGYGFIQASIIASGNKPPQTAFGRQEHQRVAQQRTYMSPPHVLCGTVVPWAQQLQCSRLFLLWATDWCAT